MEGPVLIAASGEFWEGSSESDQYGGRGHVAQSYDSQMRGAARKSMWRHMVQVSFWWGIKLFLSGLGVLLDNL